MAIDFPAGDPNIPTAALTGETLGTMHAGAGHPAATNRLLTNIKALGVKLGYGSSSPGGTAGVLRRTSAGNSAWGQIALGDHAAGSVANGDLAGAIDLTKLVHVGAGNLLRSDGTQNVPGKLALGDIAPSGTNSRVLKTNASGAVVWGQVAGPEVDPTSALSIASLTATGTGAFTGALSSTASLSTQGPISTQLGVSGAYFNGGNVGQGELRANILHSATVTADGALNGASLNVGAGAVTAGVGNFSGRVTGNEATWGLYAATGGVLSAGLIQGQVGGNALAIYAPGGQIRSDAGGNALYAPNGNLQIGGSVNGASLNVGGGGVTCGTVNASGNLNTSAAVVATSILQTNSNVSYSLYAPSGGLNVAGSATMASIACSGQAQCGTLHISGTTVYGGGSSATAAYFFYIIINGAGYKVPLFL